MHTPMDNIQFAWCIRAKLYQYIYSLYICTIVCHPKMMLFQVLKITYANKKVAVLVFAIVYR